MDFLASAPDVQLDWNAMTLSHGPNSSMSPFSFEDAPTFERARPLLLLQQQQQQQQQAAAAFGASQSAAAMREMAFRVAAMRPVHVDPESVKPPRRRRNVRISKDPQSTAARLRRERISERIRILQRLVPGGTKMDTASMLDEAVHYLKFLKGQVRIMERAGFGGRGGIVAAAAGPSSGSSSSWCCSGKIEQVSDYELVGNNAMHLLS